ncbi:Flp family type IVb pilin [Pseudomonas asplenii]|uniref:Flp family type IVb pilin n=1 Tax=Pseudomonas asplenii TaxID=53407 RepID=UPI0037CAAB49
MIRDFITRLCVQVQLFIQRKEAASGIEYAIVAAMVAIVIISYSTEISTKIGNVFKGISNGLGT